MRKFWLNSIPLTLVLLAFLYLQGRLIRTGDKAIHTAIADSEKSSDHFRRPVFHSSFYRYSSLGHTQTLVDWYIIRSSVDDDLRWVDSQNRSYVYYQYDLMTDLDPFFMGLYVNGANYLTVAKNDNHGALSLIEKGRLFYEREYTFLPKAKRYLEWTTAWRLHLIEGYLRLFELQDISGAMAVYEKLDQFNNLPLSLERVSTKIKSAAGRIQIGLNSVKNMLESTRPDLSREKMLAFKSQLLISQFLLYWNQQWRGFRATQRSTSPDRLWKEFLNKAGMPLRDPVGGEVYLNSESKIWTRSAWKPLVNEESEF